MLIPLICTQCGGELEVEKSQVVEAGDSVIVLPDQTFNCPHCNTKYLPEEKIGRAPVKAVISIGGSVIGSNIIVGNNMHAQYKSGETMKTQTLTNWQAIGIGTVIGILATGIVFAFTYSMDLFDNQGRLAFAGWEILLSVVGAMIGKSRKRTWRAMWIGAILGALSPGFLAIIWILVVVLIAGTLIG